MCPWCLAFSPEEESLLSLGSEVSLGVGKTEPSLESRAPKGQSQAEPVLGSAVGVFSCPFDRGQEEAEAREGS